ncbi:hypothetical protein [Planomonospora alba]
MSCDRGEGVDYGRVAYARRPSGEPVFDGPEVFAAGIRPHEGMPGFALLHAHPADEPSVRRGADDRGRLANEPAP